MKSLLYLIGYRGAGKTTVGGLLANRLGWSFVDADVFLEGQCGWLKDKFGMSWQVTPTVLIDMLHDSDEEKSGRVMQAMLQMKKIDIKTLKEAYER